MLWKRKILMHLMRRPIRPPPPSNNVESFNSVVIKFVHCQISKGLCLGLKFLNLPVRLAIANSNDFIVTCQRFYYNVYLIITTLDFLFFKKQFQAHMKVQEKLVTNTSISTPHTTR